MSRAAEREFRRGAACLRPGAGTLPPYVFAWLLLGLFAAFPLAARDSIIVGSKNFEESRLLGEVFAQLIEARTGLRVERRLGMAGTQICFEALRTGAIDVYPEYTGTGLVSILGETSTGGRAAALVRVRAEFLDRFDLHWLVPLGFENSFEIAVPKELAEREGMHTLSDLAKIAPRLKAGFGQEFVGRDDGLPGLEKTYGLHFGSVRSLEHAIKYQAAGRREIDALDVYTTDARLIEHRLVVLTDDRDFFPPYEAAALVRGETLQKHPEVGAVLGLLAGAFDEERMRAVNFRLEHGESETAVARDVLAELGLGADPSAARARPPEEGKARERAGFFAYLVEERAALWRRTLEHLGLSGLALLLGVLVAVPFGLLLERRRRLAEPAIRLLGITQTIPSLALLAFMLPWLGIGARPAIVALWIYSLFPIVRNTYSGVRDADPRAVEAALALGMTEGQVLRQVRLPLALPIVLAGIRTAAVLTVGTATLAAFVGAGGLGEPIITGLQLADNRRILSGALPAALLAVGVDALLGALERALRPRGL